MSGSVTVSGSNGQTFSLQFDTKANLALATQIADAINAGVASLSVAPFVDTDGRVPPPVPAGKVGEYVKTEDGATFVPKGYDIVVNDAANGVIFGNGSGAETVLSGSGDLTFFAASGGGTIVGGGGDSRVFLGPGDTGSWDVQLGGGNDIVFALNSGQDTINADGGRNIVIGGQGSIHFLGGSESDGSSTVQGGSAGRNHLEGGAGSATLFGAANGDVLLAQGSHGQRLQAGSGSETLSAAASTGNDTLIGGHGHNTMVGGSGSDLFVVNRGGGTTLVIDDFRKGDAVGLHGFRPNEAGQAVAHQTHFGGSTQVVLSDGTKVTFTDVAHVNASEFKRV